MNLDLTTAVIENTEGHRDEIRTPGCLICMSLFLVDGILIAGGGAARVVWAKVVSRSGSGNVRHEADRVPVCYG